ncbi:hypothetical protein LguiB_009664 [Lonicera macranthoides]
MANSVQKSEQEWRAVLSPEQFRILRQKGTEYISLLELNSMAGELAYCGALNNYFSIDIGRFVLIENDETVLLLKHLLNEEKEVDLYLECIQHICSSLEESTSHMLIKSGNENKGCETENENRGFEIETDSGSSSGCESMYDSEFDSDHDIDDLLFDANVDPDAEKSGVRENNSDEGVDDAVRREENDEGVDDAVRREENDEENDEGVDDAIRREENDEGIDTTVGGDREENSENNCDELRSLCDLDDEGGENPTYPVFNTKNDMSDPVFKLGMIFKDRKEVKEAIKVYSIKHGKEIKFKKNESSRIRAVCRDGCPWLLFASKMSESRNMQIKTLNEEHKCNRQFRNTHVNSRWLSEQYMDTFRANPKIPMKYFKETVMRDHVVNVSVSQAYRTRKKAMRRIQGTYTKQYAKLWDYMEEVRRTNLGSTIVMKVDEQSLSEAQPKFLRLYMCFAACKQGFLAGCKPFIGVDGCHLKSHHKGILLAAIGVDANNFMFPIAVAVVEGETKSYWSWFLELLKEDVGVINQHGWTFMSDKQKGLIHAFEEVMPLVHHR